MLLGWGLRNGSCSLTACRAHRRRRGSRCGASCAASASPRSWTASSRCPRTADTREQLEWLAEDVVQAGGEATIWLAEPATAAEHRRLAAAMTERIDAEYRAISSRGAATVGAAGRRSGAARSLGCAASSAESARANTSRPIRRSAARDAVEALADAVAAEAAA